MRAAVVGEKVVFCLAKDDAAVHAFPVENVERELWTAGVGPGVQLREAGVFNAGGIQDLWQLRMGKFFFLQKAFHLDAQGFANDVMPHHNLPDAGLAGEQCGHGLGIGPSDEFNFILGQVFL